MLIKLVVFYIASSDVVVFLTSSRFSIGWNDPYD